MNEQEIIQNALIFINEMGQAIRFEEYLKEKGYTSDEIEEMWNQM